MTLTPEQVDALPPTQYLILEVLAARYRSGEAAWNFPTKVKAHLDALSSLGLIGWKNWTVPKVALAWLTDEGVAAVLSDTYVPPGRDTVAVGVHRLVPDLPLPSYAHPGDAGADLYAAEDATIPSGGWALVRTGVALAIPDGYVGLVHPRSGLAVRHGVTVLNAPGTVDAGYRGEVMVNLINHGPQSYAVCRGDRIAQLVVQRVERAAFVEVDELPESARGAGGHGSTGGTG